MSVELDIIANILKLARGLRRCPPPLPDLPVDARGHTMPFPPALGRLLSVVADNPNVSSRDLCELMDMRPSSLSEILARAESDGWITRYVNKKDHRVQKIRLSKNGRALTDGLKAINEEDARQKTSCLTEEEKILFCEMCNRLFEHMESLEFQALPPFPEGPGGPGPDDFEGPDGPEGPEPPHRGPGRPRKVILPGSKIRC